MIESPSILVFGACAYTPCGKFSGTDPNLSAFLFMLLFQYSALYASLAPTPEARPFETCCVFQAAICRFCVTTSCMYARSPGVLSQVSRPLL